MVNPEFSTTELNPKYYKLPPFSSISSTKYVFFHNFDPNKSEKNPENSNRKRKHKYSINHCIRLTSPDISIIKPNTNAKKNSPSFPPSLIHQSSAKQPITDPKHSHKYIDTDPSVPIQIHPI